MLLCTSGSIACDTEQQANPIRFGCRVCLIATATPRELPPIARARRAYAPDATAPAEWDFRWSSAASARRLSAAPLASGRIEQRRAAADATRDRAPCSTRDHVRFVRWFGAILRDRDG